MSQILHITASIRNQESVTRKLSNQLVTNLKQRNSSAVIERDLSENSLPLLNEVLFAANSTPAQERTQDQQALAQTADNLIAELEQAGTLVLSLPMYNFAAPATFKVWADLVARAGRTFRYTENGPEGLLKDKKAYLVVATGGTPIGSDFDQLTPWVKLFLGFLGISDVEVISAEGMMADDAEQKIQQAIEKIATAA